MIKINFEQILQKIIIICAFAVFLAPLIIVNNFFLPFVFPKAMFFRVLSEIMLLGYLTLLFSNFKKYRPRLSGLIIVTGIFLLAMILAAIFSVSPYTSFWGTLERMEGLLSFIHYWIFFVILTVIFQDKKNWFRIFNFSVLIALFIDFYSLLQRLGWSALVGSDNEDRFRAVGTIGNPAFLAVFLLLNCLLLLILFIKTKQRWLRFVYGMIFIFHLIVIYLTNTRGVLLGLIVGLFLFSIFYFISFPQSKLRKYFIIIFLAVVAVVSLLFINRDKPWVQQNNSLAHLTDVSLGTSGSIKTRLMAWQIGWQGFKEKPLLGWGPENYNIVFNKYFKSEYLTGFNQTVWYDRAHNMVVEVATTMGIIGLISYLAIFIYLFIKLFKYWRRSEDKNDKLIAVILAAGFVAYFIQNIFIFDTVNSYIMLFLIFAYINFLFQKEKHEKIENEISTQRFKIWLLPVLIIIFFIPFVRSVIHPSLANGYGALAKAYFTAKIPVKGMELFQKSFKYGTFCDAEILDHAEDVIGELADGQNNFPEDKKFQYLNIAKEQAKKVLDQHPLDVRRYIVLSKNYVRLANYNEDEKAFNLAMAVKYLEEAIPLSPQRQRIYNDLAFAYLQLGNKDKALAILEEVIRTNDKIPEFYWNLFLVYEQIGDDKPALEILDKTIALNYPFEKNPAAGAHAIDFYIKLKRYDKTLPLYEILINLEKDPSNLAKWYSGLAVAYAKLGDRKKAQESALKVLDINSTYAPQVQAFLQELEKTGAK